mgnify:CR=1 FL=1
MSLITIDIFRHAQSESNAGLPTAHPVTVCLTPLGEQQARELAASFNANTPPQSITVTAYHRTGATAAPTLERFPAAEYRVCGAHEFTYLDVTKYDGLTRADRRPAVKAYWEQMDPDAVHGTGAESFNQMVQRIRTTLAAFADLPSGYHVAVNHGFTMQVMWVLLTRPDLKGRALMQAVRACQDQQPVPNVGRLRLVSERLGELRIASDWKQASWKARAMCA